MPLLMGGTDNEVLGMQSGNFGNTRYHTHPIEPTAANVTWRVYYPGGGLRAQTSSSNTLTYLLTDHLNSTTTTLDSNGSITAWLRYDAWGLTRSSSGTTPTDKRYTGQYEAEVGLYFYNARWYDPETGRFAQADTIIPEAGDPLAWDRYAYVMNNPIRYNDPSGHWVETVLDIGFIAYDIYEIKTNGLTWISGLSLAADVVGAILPVVTGAGLAVRALTRAEDVTKMVKATDKAIDALEIAAKADDIGNVVSHGDDLVDALSHVDDFPGFRQPDLPNWPSTPGEMDDILGIVGERIPDKSITPGRDKVVWNPSDNIKITYEQHPYHQTAPISHKGPHWHIDWPGVKHIRYLPGQPMPK